LFLTTSFSLGSIKRSIDNQLYAAFLIFVDQQQISKASALATVYPRSSAVGSVQGLCASIGLYRTLAFLG